MKQKLLNKLWLRVGMIVAIMTTALSGTVWAETAAGTFEINFYDSSKLSSTSGTGLTNSNYSSFVAVPTGVESTDVVTSISVTGTVQYGKNGGLTAGTGTAASANTHYVTFNINSNYAVTKCTVYATAYESGRWLLNGNAADQGSLGSKGATIDKVTTPLVWDNLGGVTALTFKKDNGSGGNQKRLTIYKIVCEYSTGGSTLTTSDLALTGAPIALTFDLYNNASNQTVSFTSSSTGAVTVSESEYVTTSVSGNTITVTPVKVTPSAQTITVNQEADGTYKAGQATFTVTITDSTPFAGGDVTFVAGTDKGSTSGNNSPDAVTKSGVTMSSTDAAFATAEYRLYSGSTTTFSTSSGKITKIVFTKTGSYSLSNLSTETGTYNSSTGTWTGNVQSVVFDASAQVRLSQIVVTVTSADALAAPAITGTTPFVGSTTITITAEEGASIYYTVDGTDPTTSSTLYSAPFTINATTTVKAIAVKDSKTSSVAEATFTKATVMTVAEARAAIDENGTVSDAYVSGIVSQVDEYNSSYSSITYWISDDGTTTNQLEVYSGKGLNGADFNSIDDIQVGDVVVVKGELKKHNEDYEFNYNNELVSITTKADPELAFATTEYTVAPGAEFTAPTLTNPNNLTITYSSSDDNLAVVDENTGEVLIGDEEGTVTITASFAGDATYRAGSASYTISIVDNTKGTIDNPYTVADVIAGKASGKTGVYVIGYIVGEFVGSTSAPRTSDFTTDANIALADEFTTSPTVAASIPVALPSDALKTAWGCKTNDGSTIGTKVIVCGNGASYFSVNGIKNTSSVTAVQSVTVSSAGYATFASDNALDFTGSSIKAFYATESAGTLSFTQVNKVPAGTGVLLYADGGATVDVPVFTGEADAVTGNVFVRGAGTAVTYAENNQNYILFDGEDGIGFYRANNNTVATNRAYIHVTSGSGNGVKSFAINLEDDATGISLMEDGRSQMEDGVIYNVAGQRLDNSQFTIHNSQLKRGIYIVNGKKILK